MAAARLKVPVVEAPVLTDGETGGGAADSVEEARRAGAAVGRRGATGRGAAAADGLLRDGGAQLRRRHAFDSRRPQRDHRRVRSSGVDDVVRFFRDAEKAGTFTVAEKPAEPVGKKKKAK